MDPAGYVRPFPLTRLLLTSPDVTATNSARKNLSLSALRLRALERICERSVLQFRDRFETRPALRLSPARASDAGEQSRRPADDSVPTRRRTRAISGRHAVRATGQFRPSPPRSVRSADPEFRSLRCAAHDSDAQRGTAQSSDARLRPGSDHRGQHCALRRQSRAQHGLGSACGARCS